MMDIQPMEYDVDMDRFYIPVNSRYEIQTKGKGSSFRIANTKTHNRMLVTDERLHSMLEDMAKGTNAEMRQQQDEIQSLRHKLSKLEVENIQIIGKNEELMARVAELEADAKRYRWLKDNYHGFEMFRNSPIKYVTLDSEVDKAMEQTK